MNKYTQLFIRACKSNNPKQRVQSVYNRFYGKFADSETPIAGLLLEICEDYNLLTLSKLASELDPNHPLRRLFPERCENNYWQNVINICTSAIRLTTKDKLEGFISPRRFR
jgi:hypothetical protein